MPAIACPHCGGGLKVPDEAIGKKVRCKKCQQVFVCQLAPEPEADGPTSLDTARRAATQVASAAGGILKVAGQLITRPAAEPVSVPEPALSPLLAQLTTDGQDIEKAATIVGRVKEILITGEEVRYVAVQARPVVNLFPDAIVLTNRRFIAYHPKVLNRVDFEDYIWRDLKDVQVKEDIIGATLSFTTIGGRRFSMDYLPKVQARQLYRIAQEQEQLSLEERRQRQMEESRAAAGGVFIQNTLPTQPVAPVAAPDDPVQRLSKLKAMREADLISAAEFEQKKAAILESM